MREINEQRLKSVEKRNTQELLDFGISTLDDIINFYNTTVRPQDNYEESISQFKSIIKGLLKDVIFYCSDRNAAEHLKKMKNNYIIILTTLQYRPVFPRELEILRRMAILKLKEL